MSYKTKTDKRGNKFYYLNSKLHREDGPAIEYITGETDWCLNGEYYGYDDEFTNESWKRFIKTLIFS